VPASRGPKGREKRREEKKREEKGGEGSGRIKRKDFKSVSDHLKRFHKTQ
jgi:hypothetical protein